MKKAVSVIILLMSALFSQAQVPGDMEYAVLPTPAEMKFGSELCLLPDSIVMNGYLGKPIVTLRDEDDIRLYSSILNIPVSSTLKVKLPSEDTDAVVLLWDEKLDAGISFYIKPELTKYGKEYYSIRVGSHGATIHIADQRYLVYALQTLRQLFIYKDGKTYLPYCEITDYPDSEWRGLLLDVCRHFIPLRNLYRTIDAMSACKMNVLHLHLSDDQAFRLECRSFPLLHQKGNDGQYYTQEEIKALIKYASDRGVQIVPEFDIPGHTTAWLSAYPEYASFTIPQKPETGYGIFKPVMNPTNKDLYKHLDLFFKEVSALFPSEYVHIGGDEVRSDDWLNNPDIKKFMKKKGYTTVPQLQNYFNARVEKILTKYKKKVIGWDEILEGKPSKGTIIQSWRGELYQKEAIAQGYGVIRSNGFYLDQTYTAGEYYARFDTLNSPLYLGGEAAMWSELVDSITVESRIWPNAAAIAEMYWRHPEKMDSISFYRRVYQFSGFLNDRLEIRHEAYVDKLSKQRNEDFYYKYQLYGYLVPIDGYRRHRIIKADSAYNTSYVLNTYADIGKPTSWVYMAILLNINEYKQSLSPERKERLKKMFMNFAVDFDKRQVELLQNPEWKELTEINAALIKSNMAAILWLSDKEDEAKALLAEARQDLKGREYELSIFNLLEEAMK